MGFRFSVDSSSGRPLATIIKMIGGSSKAWIALLIMCMIAKVVQTKPAQEKGKKKPLITLTITHGHSAFQWGHKGNGNNNKIDKDNFFKDKNDKESDTIKWHQNNNNNNNSIS